MRRVAPPAPAGLLISLLATGAAAQAPVSPEAFEARATGHTLHFTNEGLPYGSEQFFEGRRTLWQAWEGTCRAGIWYDRGDLVCFVYETEAGPLCWRMRETGGRLSAVLVEDGVETMPVLDLAHTDRTPLDCPGPDIGS